MASRATSFQSREPSMLRFFLLTVAFWIGAFAPAAEVSSVSERESALRELKTKRLRLFFIGDFKQEAPRLAQLADDFLSGLEKEWAVILPTERIEVSLSKFRPSDPEFSRLKGPSWLFSAYDPQRRRIELRVTAPQEFEMRYVFQALTYHLVNGLLRQADANNPLPAFLREGLAQHYGRPVRTRDRALAIWGLNQTEDLPGYLMDDRHFEQESSFYYAAALSRGFITWLDELDPRGETLFLQKFLSGKPWRAAFAEAGMPEPEMLLVRFEARARQAYRLRNLVWTLDFWLITLGALALIGMAVKLVMALRLAMITFVPQEALAPVAAPIDADLFTGPVFEGLRQGTGLTPDAAEPAAPAARPDESFDSADLDEDLDQAFADMLDSKPADKTPVQAPASSWAKARATPPAVTEEPKADKPGDLEDDIDSVFDDWSSQDRR